MSDSDTRFKNICLELLVIGFSIAGGSDSSTERRVIGRALARPIMPKSDAVGRCSMNSGKILSFDIKMTYGKNSAANGQLDFFVMFLFSI